MNLIKSSESECECYILKKDNSFWGVEDYGYGSTRSYGIVSNTDDILFFDEKVKPKDSRSKIQAWIDSAEFLKVKITKIEKVELV